MDAEGRSNFPDLMARREPRYYAFDLVWLNGQGLRSKPLLERKRRLRRLVPWNDSHLPDQPHRRGTHSALESGRLSSSRCGGLKRVPWFSLYGVQAEAKLKMQGRS